MSLPELTMQGLPSTSMRMFQKRQQRQWQQTNSSSGKEGMDGQEFDGEDDDETGGGGGGGGRRGGRKSKFKKKSKKNGRNGGGGGSAYDDYYNNNKGMPFPGPDEDGYKAIMEDQYYPLVILIEATKEYNPAGKNMLLSMCR